jgi:hypothetical protein
MGLFRKKTPADAGGLTRGQALSFVPVKNRAVTEERRDADRLRLTYPVTVRPAFSEVLRRVGIWDGRPSNKVVELDVMGGAAWELVDGERSVREVAAAFAERFRLGGREAEVAVSAFLRNLGRRGLVGFRAPGGGEGA